MLGEVDIEHSPPYKRHLRRAGSRVAEAQASTEHQMAERMGLLAKKIGMTQVFDDKGNWASLTVLQVGPCVVLDLKTRERDGYSAIKLGFGEQKPQRVNRPEAGVFAKAETTPKRFVREIRLSEEELAQFQRGQTLTVERVFRKGDIIDVTGTSRGKGFQGVMKRHHFKGFRASHGTHEYFRHGGSIGCRLTPGRVFKGMRMPGHMGARRVTVQGIRVYEVVPEQNLLLISGAAPGAPDGYAIVRQAAKRLLPPFELLDIAPPAVGGGEPAAAAAEA